LVNAQRNGCISQFARTSEDETLPSRAKEDAAASAGDSDSDDV
jgi:hypothetical protein